eukprot:g4343.t1
MLAISSRVAAPASGAHRSSFSALDEAPGSKSKQAHGKLGFYREYPVDKIELDEFEQYAIDRLQEDLRRWFLAQECALFSLRFANAGPAQIDAFMEKAGLRYVPISAEEKERLSEPLLAVYRGSIYGVANASIAQAQKVFSRQDFYRVPFTDVLPLVSKRTVYLEDGFAYVPRSQLATIVQGAFRAHLSRELAVAYKSMALIQSDERIAPLVRNLGRIAYRLGRANTAADAETVLQTFMSHLVELGHSQPKSKPAGQDRFYVAVGYRKANERDRTCPIAGRCHKSNTQKYTVFVDTQVMQQGCWDSVCQETGKHIYYQIQGNKVVNCGWNPPPPPQVADTSANKLEAGSSSGRAGSGAATVQAPAFNKK